MTQSELMFANWLAACGDAGVPSGPCPEARRRGATKAVGGAGLPFRAALMRRSVPGWGFAWTLDRLFLGPLCRPEVS